MPIDQTQPADGEDVKAQTYELRTTPIPPITKRRFLSIPLLSRHFDHMTSPCNSTCLYNPRQLYRYVSETPPRTSIPWTELCSSVNTTRKRQKSVAGTSFVSRCTGRNYPEMGTRWIAAHIREGVRTLYWFSVLSVLLLRAVEGWLCVLYT